MECAKPRQLEAAKENNRNVWLKGPSATESALRLDLTTMSLPPLAEKMALAGSGWAVLFPSSAGVSCSGDVVVTSPTSMFSLENEVKKRMAPAREFYMSFSLKGLQLRILHVTNGNLKSQTM